MPIFRLKTNCCHDVHGTFFPCSLAVLFCYSMLRICFSFCSFFHLIPCPFCSLLSTASFLCLHIVSVSFQSIFIHFILLPQLWQIHLIGLIHLLFHSSILPVYLKSLVIYSLLDYTLVIFMSLCSWTLTCSLNTSVGLC